MTLHARTSEDFYAALPVHAEFGAVARTESYAELPSDWLVVVTDIHGSTAAVERGLYKDVNLLGVPMLASATTYRFLRQSALAVCGVLPAALGSCVSLNTYEKAKLAELEASGIARDSQASAIPGLAGALNILPGVGDVYLAIDSGEGAMWANFVPDLLLWPVSVLWAIPQAVVNGNRIQEAQTAEHYIMIDLMKKAEAPKTAGTHP